MKNNRSPFSGIKSDITKRAIFVVFDLYKYFSEYMEYKFSFNFPEEDFLIFQIIFSYNSTFNWSSLIYDCDNEFINFAKLKYGIKPCLVKLFKFLLEEIPTDEKITKQRKKKIMDENHDGEKVLKFVNKYFKNNKIDESLFLISDFDKLFNIKIDIDDKIENKFCFKINVCKAKDEFLEYFHHDFNKRFAAKDYLLINSIEFEFNNEQIPEIIFEPVYVAVKQYENLHVDHPLKHSCLEFYLKKIELEDNNFYCDNLSTICIKNINDNNNLELEEEICVDFNDNKQNFHEKNYIKNKFGAIQTQSESITAKDIKQPDSNVIEEKTRPSTDSEEIKNNEEHDKSKITTSSKISRQDDSSSTYDNILMRYQPGYFFFNPDMDDNNDLKLKEISFEFNDNKLNSGISRIKDEEIAKQKENVKIIVSQKNNKKSVSSKD